MLDPPRRSMFFRHIPMEPPRNPLGTSRTVPFIVGFGISAKDRAERTPRELQGPISKPWPGLS
eukprot:6569064-Alexandrium_andersonii.AAC.1